MKDFLRFAYENSYKIVGVLILLFILVVAILWAIVILVTIIS